MTDMEPKGVAREYQQFLDWYKALAGELLAANRALLAQVERLGSGEPTICTVDVEGLARDMQGYKVVPFGHDPIQAARDMIAKRTRAVCLGDVCDAITASAELHGYKADMARAVLQAIGARLASDDGRAENPGS